MNDIIVTISWVGEDDPLIRGKFKCDESYLKDLITLIEDELETDIDYD